MRSVLCLPGGKYYSAKEIINMFPPHSTYLEPFGGGASVLLNKSRSHWEIYNDIDKGLYAIFHCLQKKPLEFMERIENLQHSRDWFIYCMRWKPVKLLDRAIREFSLIKLSFSGKRKHFVMNPKALPKNLDILRGITKRLRGVIIENKDWRWVMDRWNFKTTFAYLDPPYLGVKGWYKHEAFNHKELAEYLETWKGKFLLSQAHNPETMKIFKRFKYKKLKVDYTMGIHRPGTELLFKNYLIAVTQKLRKWSK